MQRLVPLGTPRSSAALSAEPGAPPTTMQEPLCPYCKTSIAADETVMDCPACRSTHHEECWEENGGCTLYGCEHLPETEHHRGIDIPAGHWGQEHKACPKCGNEIRASAVRCRSCGATFTANPEDAGAYFERQVRDERLPAAKRTAILIAVLCFLPCTAPFAAFIGGIWYYNRRELLSHLPSIYPTICKLSIGFAVVLFLLLILATMWYSLLS